MVPRRSGVAVIIMHEALTTAANADQSSTSSSHSPGGTARLADIQDDPQALLREYARTRDIQVRNRLVVLHERMVRYLASRFGSGAGTSLEDLVQVGYVGLIAAIDRFDPDKGVSFVTFAVPTILGEIKRYFRDQTWGLKAPRRLRELGLSLRKLREQLEQSLGRPPTIAEMAEAANVSEERLLQAMDLDRIYQPASLDAHLQDENGDDKSSFWEAIGRSDPELIAIEEREMVRHALERLDQRQRTIIYYRFFEEASQAEVAGKLGISQMHVSRLERQALKRLRALLD
jgi:RNA polymerase sigma-B factor